MDIKIGGEVAGKGNLGDALNISEAGAAGVDLFVTTDKATIGETFGLSGEIPLPLSEGTFVPFRVVDESTIGFWSRFWSYFK